MEKGQLSPSGSGSVIAANKNPAGNKKSQNNWYEIYRKNHDVSGPGLFWFSLDAVFWIDLAEWWHPRLLAKTDWSPWENAWDAFALSLSLSHLPWSSLCFLAHLAHGYLHPVDSWVNSPQEVIERKKIHSHHRCNDTQPFGKDQKNRVNSGIAMAWLEDFSLAIWSDII